MQTLSSMRRNSTYHRVIVPFGLFVLAIIYASISSMSLYLTPLLGVGFYYIIKHIHDKNRYFDFFLIALYSLYIEIDRGLVLFSFILFTILFYILVFRTFKKFIYCQICLVVIYISIGYIGYFMFNIFFAYVIGQNIPYFSINYLFYILSDILIVLVFS